MDGANATCGCNDDEGNNNKNVSLSCVDNCQICNQNKTVCAVNNGYEYKLDESGETYYFSSTHQYIKGRNDTIVFEYEESTIEESYDWSCSVTVNGQKCNSCNHITCRGGYGAYEVSCENLLGDDVGNAAPCDFDVVPDVEGPLALFWFQDPVNRVGCPPRFLNWY